jgi:hypothetical protein
MINEQKQRFYFVVVAVLALAGFASNANAVLIEYDSSGRPILFDNLTYSHYVGSIYTTFNYDVTVTWDTFDNVYGTGYKNPGDPYDEPDFLTGTPYGAPISAMANALVADGFTSPHPITGLEFGPSELFGSYLLIPYSLGEVSSGDWVVYSEGLNIGHYIFSANPINYYADSFIGGHTIFHSADTYDLSAVPVPPAMLLFGSGLVGLAAAAKRTRRKKKA